MATQTITSSATPTFSENLIEAADIAALSNPEGWLTDTCIREIVASFHYPTISNLRINFIDPSWFAAWIQGGCVMPESDPDFLSPKPGSTERLAGLAIPWNVAASGGCAHWVTIYINLEAKGAVLFDSARDPTVAALGKKLARQFYNIFLPNFADEFDGGHEGKFRYLVDVEHSAVHRDGWSCGVYTIRNCLDLMNHCIPDGTVLNPTQFETFKRLGRNCLEEKMRSAEKKGSLSSVSSSYRMRF